MLIFDALLDRKQKSKWIPAFAGMTAKT